MAGLERANYTNATAPTSASNSFPGVSQPPEGRGTGKRIISRRVLFLFGNTYNGLGMVLSHIPCQGWERRVYIFLVDQLYVSSRSFLKQLFVFHLLHILPAVLIKTRDISDYTFDAD
jgi:hypothetical protein